MPIELVRDVVEPLRRGERPVVKSLEVEFIPVRYPPPPTPLPSLSLTHAYPCRW